MSDLISKIRSSQIRAGEDAVCDHLREMGLLDDQKPIAGVHRPMTSLEVAEDLEGGLNSYGSCSLAANMLRQQHAEIERLKRERHHIYDLLARIHRDGGQYTADHGVEKSCDDAEAQVVTWLETISSVDSLIEQARIAEREACAKVCDELEALLPGTKTGNTLQWAAESIRARGKS